MRNATCLPVCRSHSILNGFVLHSQARGTTPMPASVQSPPRRLCFGSFELDPASGELHQDGRKVPLPHKAFELLRALAEHSGEVVTREELRAKLWSANTFVEFDDGLNHAVKNLRQALGDSAENPQFIETLPRYGYRFLAAVEAAPTPGPEPVRLRRSTITAVVTTVALLAIVALLVFIPDGWRGRFSSNANEPPIRSLAVLPLSNLSGDPQQDYFADGMTDALITDVAKIRGLKVISRTSVMQFKDVKRPLPEVARRLGVDGIIEGSVQRSGGRVRITAQLIRAATDTHLWAESYEGDTRDVLALQEEIARDVAKKIKVALTPEEQIRLASARSVNPEAYELYLKGRYEWNKRTQAGLKKGLEYFQRAINLDPTYALAYSGIADSYTMLANNRFVSGSEVYSGAKAAALKALELDPNSAETHTSLAYVLFCYEWDPEAAMKELRTAIELNPNYATAHHWYAVILAEIGQSEEAMREMEQARKLDPLSVRISANVGHLLYLRRQYDQAILETRKALELEPNDRMTHERLGETYLQMGMSKEALAEYRLISSSDELDPGLVCAYAAAGNRKEALRILSWLKQKSKREYIAPYYMIRAYTALGEKDEALAWLQKGVETYSGGMDRLKVDPAFDPLRGDPRFQKLLRRMKFPQ